MPPAALQLLREEDCPPDALADERVAVLGYGNLGRSFALNLRDSGVEKLRVGNVADDKAENARQDRFPTVEIPEATRDADIVLVMLPDEVIPEVFSQQIAPRLSPRAALVFASGYVLAYGLIETPSQADVLLLAPRMNGAMIRELYTQGRGAHAYVSVEQDRSGRAWARLLGLAHALGALRAGVLELDARGEANLDLFIEQTLGAVLGYAIMTAFKVGAKAGLPPEALAMEMYMSGEMEMVWRGFRTEGFRRSASAHGPTAMYGGLLRTLELMQTDLADRFRRIWEEVQTGQFAAKFQKERRHGYPLLNGIQTLAKWIDPMTATEERLQSALGQNNSRKE